MSVSEVMTVFLDKVGIRFSWAAENIVGDKNKNDKWDPFDPILFIGPEKRFEYGKPIKIKANWEHEIDFVINL